MTEQEWTSEVVQARFEEAVDTLRRLPNPVYLGYVSRSPEIIYSARELEWQESVTLKRHPPLPEAIERLDHVLTWISWPEEKERKIIWMRAEGTRWKDIGIRMYMGRTTAWRYWKSGLKTINNRLNKS